MIHFSIVIPTYKRNIDLLACLKAIQENKLAGLNESFEIIVTDDNDNDEAKNFLSQFFPGVKWIKGPQKGPAANRNNGAKSAKGDWIIFLDDDCIPSSKWINSFIYHFKDNVDVLEGKTISDREQSRLNEEAPLNHTGGNLWSCNFAIRKKTFFEVGMFDEGYPYAAMEDTDFYIRLIESGKSVLFVPNAIVVHPWRLILPFKGVVKKRLHSQKYFLDKYMPKRTISFRWARFKILILNTSQDIYKLICFKGRGFIYFFERLYFNLMMIFI